ncbi:DUF1905 domain-containing protein [Candidatus Woesebacteria bacterium]|jgi:hypothetical protein|nr:DUF1905 domain-containing protein [Candidatus Woesebacteria bacterium]
MSTIPTDSNNYTITAYLWLYPGNASWHFLTIPEEISNEISTRYAEHKRGWGSLPVTATIGATSWDTSIFPDKESRGYLLPVKALIRKKESIRADQEIQFQIRVRV